MGGKGRRIDFTEELSSKFFSIVEFASFERMKEQGDGGMDIAIGLRQDRWSKRVWNGDVYAFQWMIILGPLRRQFLELRLVKIGGIIECRGIASGWRSFGQRTRMKHQTRGSCSLISCSAGHFGRGDEST